MTAENYPCLSAYLKKINTETEDPMFFTLLRKYLPITPVIYFVGENFSIEITSLKVQIILPTDSENFIHFCQFFQARMIKFSVTYNEWDTDDNKEQIFTTIISKDTYLNIEIIELLYIFYDVEGCLTILDENNPLERIFYDNVKIDMMLGFVDSARFILEIPEDEETKKKEFIKELYSCDLNVLSRKVFYE